MAETTSTRDSGEEWSLAEVQQLRELADGNTPSDVLSSKLGRSEDVIRSKARAEGISLAPSISSPYERSSPAAAPPMMTKASPPNQPGRTASAVN